MNPLDTHFRKDVGKFSRNTFGNRLICGEPRFELFCAIKWRLIVFARKAIDVIVQLAQKFARFIIELAAVMEFPIQFREQLGQSFTAHCCFLSLSCDICVDMI